MAEQSSTGYPRAPGASGPDDPQTKTICGTVELDSTFKTLYDNNSYYAEYYVGFPDGGRRSFPGKEEADPTLLYPCKSYDSRLKTVVQRRDIQPKSPGHSGGLEVEAVINVSDPQTHEELRPLKKKLDELQPAQDDAGVSSSDLAAGLQEASRLFGGVNDMDQECHRFYERRHLVRRKAEYDTGRALRRFRQVVRIQHEEYGREAPGPRRCGRESARLAHPLTFPLYEPSLRPGAYFLYLAEMQIRSDRTFPYWTPVYRDFHDVGLMFTVVTPAFSKSERKRFIGVVAIDVLYEELGDIKEDFQIALTHREFNGASSDAYARVFQTISMTVYDFNVLASCDIKRKENALCTPSNRVDPNENFLERFCCSECSGGGSDRLTTLLIALPTAVVGFLVLVSLSFVAVWCWCRQSTLTVVEDENVASTTATGRKSTDGLGLRSPRARKVELANNSSGPPLQIHQSVIRFGVDKFTSPPHANPRRSEFEASL